MALIKFEKAKSHSNKDKIVLKHAWARCSLLLLFCFLFLVHLVELGCFFSSFAIVPLVLGLAVSLPVSSNGSFRFDQVSSEDAIVPFYQQICGSRFSLQCSQAPCQLLFRLELCLSHLVLISAESSWFIHLASFLLESSLFFNLLLLFLDFFFDGFLFFFMFLYQHGKLIEILVPQLQLSGLFLGVSSHTLEKLKVLLGTRQFV